MRSLAVLKAHDIPLKQNIKATVKGNHTHIEQRQKQFTKPGYGVLELKVCNVVYIYLKQLTLHCITSLHHFH